MYYIYSNDIIECKLNITDYMPTEDLIYFMIIYCYNILHNFIHEQLLKEMGKQLLNY